MRPERLLRTAKLPKCKCGANIGLAMDGDRHRCPACIMKERDELLAACKGVVGAWENDGVLYRERAVNLCRAVLAAAEGE